MNLIFCHQAHGDVYRCEDHDGLIQMTNMPTMPGCKKIMIEKAVDEALKLKEKTIRLKQIAKKMELAIKKIYSNDKFKTKCFFDDGIKCSLSFPAAPSGTVPLRHIHEAQALTRDIAYGFAGIKSPESFWIQSFVKMYDSNMLVCKFFYSKDFDSMTPIYTVQ